MTGRTGHPLIGPDRLQKLAIVYLRQSTMEQVRHNTGSTAAQLDQQQLARDLGWPEELIKVIDKDLGLSGTGTRHRPGFQEMAGLITSGRVSAVFVLLVSRLARELLGFEELRVLCKIYNVAMVIDGRPADPNNPDDTVMLQLQAVLAQHANSSQTKLMARIRREKAKRGELVSRLPVGWIENSAGELIYDPEVEAVIRDAIATFRAHPTVLATVRELDRRGVQLPHRFGRRLRWVRANARGVRQFLVNPAYAGDYVYGKSEGRPDLGMQKNGYPLRRAVPEERWIRVRDHHPAYLTRDEQQRIREILKSNRFECRRRPRKGRALAQGILRCKRCAVSLSVQYARSGVPRYHCQRNLTTFGKRRCMDFGGDVLDAAIERLFLAAATAPSVAALRAELDDLRVVEQGHADYRQLEFKRLEYEERRAYDRYHECDPRNRLIAAILEKEWNSAIASRVAFEQNTAAEHSPSATTVPTEEEFHELLALARDVGAIWHHPELTNHDRKTLLRCLIDHIVIDKTDETIEATVHWQSGAVQHLSLWLRAGVHRLIRGRHAEGMSVREIQAWLQLGDSNTGQQWDFTKERIYALLKAWGLKPNRPARARS